MAYILDGKPITRQELIEAAKQEGYYVGEGEYFASVAVLVLTKNGHRVEYDTHRRGGSPDSKENAT